ncbi:GNAT family N-acetyltransferase [Mesorhizobium sp. L103C119B0]|uniref:GNAT family N-acetyltransferase n=1 Tax=Mesorhizobium sp. L103C119B0 TaxID=1287085 RepID=UPI001FD8BFAE|nr:GNAT family N-acetyltransferase [Mesorhizobium sp. L103C119B0]
MPHNHPPPSRQGQRTLLDEVGVSPAYQRQGIARKMLDAMFALGREQRLRRSLCWNRAGQCSIARAL